MVRHHNYCKEEQCFRFSCSTSKHLLLLSSFGFNVNVENIVGFWWLLVDEFCVADWTFRHMINFGFNPRLDTICVEDVGTHKSANFAICVVVAKAYSTNFLSVLHSFFSKLRFRTFLQYLLQSVSRSFNPLPLLIFINEGTGSRPAFRTAADTSDDSINDQDSRCDG